MHQLTGNIILDIVFWNDCPNYDDVPIPLLFRYIGPYKLAFWARSHGYQAQVIDYVMDFSEEELWSLTTKFISDKTLILGISATFLFGKKLIDPITGKTRLISREMYNVLKRIKDSYPHIKIIIGGYMAEIVSGFGLADAIVTGHAEDILLELLDHYKKQTAPPKSKMHVTFYGKKNILQYYEANQKKFNIEGDNFKFSKQDCILPNDTLPLEISRGCIFKCKFCSYPLLGRGKLDYLRDMECIKEELLYNYETFGTTRYYVLCDTFNDTEYKVNKWYKMVSSLPFEINYSAYLRADLIHKYPDMAYQLQESGLFGAFHGLESLHLDASKLVGKGWSGKHAREFIPFLYHDLWKGKVPQTLAFIVGLPGEDIDSLQQTMEWFKENKLYHLKFNNLLVSKTQPENHRSEFSRDAEKYGFKWNENGWYNEEWNFKRALQVTQELTAELKDHNKVGIWGLFSLLALGYDKQEFLIKTLPQFDWKVDFRSRRSRYLENYKNKLREL